MSARVFRKCQPCHDVGEQAKNKLGPQLNGLEGRKAGTTEGYDFSEANKSSGIVWSEELFKEYTKDPAAKIPRTKMMFSDRNEKEIGDLWALHQTIWSKWKEEIISATNKSY